MIELDSEFTSEKLDSIEIETIKDTINALVEHGFLNTTTKSKDEYAISGIFQETQISQTRTKIENDFLNEYNKLKIIVYIYLNLYEHFILEGKSELQNFDNIDNIINNIEKEHIMNP